MRAHSSRYIGVSALLVAGVIGAACSKKTDQTQTTADTTSAMANPATPQASTLTDGNIVALLDEANAGDSTLGSEALPKLTNADVKAYARMMMGEHHALRVAGNSMAQKQSITPAMPATDPFGPAVDGERSAMSSAAKGHTADSTYIAQEIGIHKAVIAWADDAAGKAQNDSLKSLISQAKPTLQHHLDVAQDLEQKLSKMAMAKH